MSHKEALRWLAEHSCKRGYRLEEWVIRFMLATNTGLRKETPQ